MKILNALISLAVTISAALPMGAAAQEFPNKPVHVVMPYPAATGPDNVMRMTGEKLAKLWGQQVVIENRPGGNGWIALEAAKRSRPDGYTLLMVDAAQMSLQPHLYKQLPYDPFKDFEPVSPMFSTNYFIVVKADSKWSSVKDLVAAAKAKEGQVTYGSSGMGSPYHLGAAMLEHGSGTRMTHVPYKETPQIFVSVANGDIDWAFATASTAGPLYQAKKVKYLAIAAPSRHSAYSSVPTIAEAGGPPGIELRTWVGLFAPTGLPKNLLQKINTDVAKVMADPEIKDKLDAVGFTAWSGAASELGKALDDDYKLFGATARRVKIDLN